MLENKDYIDNHIQQVRITRANHLLRFSKEPVEVIADACGINDANYFSHVFRKVEGSVNMVTRIDYENSTKKVCTYMIKNINII